MRQILFVNQSQFGYHIDYVKYCEYLKNHYKVSYICWDYNRPKISQSGIEIIYISREGNILSRNWRFIKKILEEISNREYNIIYSHYFKGVSILPILDRKKNNFHLDIRTGNVSPRSIKRFIFGINPNILLVENFSSL